MKHPDHVAGWNGTFEELAEAIGNMRYDSMVDFLDKLSSNIAEQASADKQRKRMNLALRLSIAAERLRDARDSLYEVWLICKPHMEESGELE